MTFFRDGFIVVIVPAVMNKVYSSLPLPPDLRERIKRDVTNANVASLLSILQHDNDIDFDRRKQLFQQVTIDPSYAESLAISSCKKSAWKVKSSDQSQSQFMKNVTIVAGGYIHKSSYAAGKEIKQTRLDLGEVEVEVNEEKAIEYARQTRDLYLMLGIDILNASG